MQFAWVVNEKPSYVLAIFFKENQGEWHGMFEFPIPPLLCDQLRTCHGNPRATPEYGWLLMGLCGQVLQEIFSQWIEVLGYDP